MTIRIGLHKFIPYIRNTVQHFCKSTFALGSSVPADFGPKSLALG
jgi:hypothetical protein